MGSITSYKIGKNCNSIVIRSTKSLRFTKPLKFIKPRWFAKPLWSVNHHSLTVIRMIMMSNTNFMKSGLWRTSTSIQNSMKTSKSHRRLKTAAAARVPTMNRQTFSRGTSHWAMTSLAKQPTSTWTIKETKLWRTHPVLAVILRQQLWAAISQGKSSWWVRTSI